LDYNDDDAYNPIYPTLAGSNYLALRHPSVKIGSANGYPLVWSEEKGMYIVHHVTSSVAYVLNDAYKAQFDHALANKGWYYLYIHPWFDADYFEGANSVRWEEWKAYIGGRSNVWYTDPDSFYNYKYLKDVVRPDISYEMVGDDLVLTVIGNSASRDKYGLSTPVTYKIKKPDSWGYDAATVEYKDTGSYALMTERNADLVTEGKFDNGGAAWSITGESTVNTGVGRIKSTGALAYVRQFLGTPMVVGEDYTAEYDITDDSSINVNGGITSNVGGITWPSTEGHHVFNFTAEETTLYFKRINPDMDISIDNVTLRPREIFTRENNFRDAGAYIYVSQGLPLNSDTFTLKVVKT
jgi:hypothetical protein